METETAASVVGNVAVIGGGLAGLTAAYHAGATGATTGSDIDGTSEMIGRYSSHVILIEKEKSLGGNSMKATSGINGLGTKFQSKSDDNVDVFLSDVLKSGKGLCDVSLARTLVSLSGDAINTLSDLGLNLSEVELLGGHTKARTHRLPVDPATGRMPPVGFTVVTHMKKLVSNLPTIETRLAHRLKDLKISEKNGKLLVTHIVVEETETGTETEIPVSAVVLTTGGFSAETLLINQNDLILQKYRPDLYGMPTTNGNFATGDVIKWALQSHNIQTLQLDQIQLHPTGFIDPKDPNNMTKFLCPEVVRGVGALLLNLNGSRFVNELGTRDFVSQAILENGQMAEKWELGTLEDEKPQKIVMLLLNQKMADRMGSSIFGFYYKVKGFLTAYSSIEDLCQKYNWDIHTFKSSLQQYDQHAQSKQPDQFGKSEFPEPIGLPSEDKPFYAGFVTPSLHYTMGGLKIDTTGRLLATSGPILNLFGAGEVVGGVHGGNRLGGNGCLESLVFGKIAGKNAAKVAEELRVNKASLEDRFEMKDKFFVHALEIRDVDETSMLLRCQLPSLLTTFTPEKDQAVWMAFKLPHTGNASHTNSQPVISAKVQGLIKQQGNQTPGIVDVTVRKQDFSSLDFPIIGLEFELSVAL